jgi:AraC-like DNA-binding protein
MTLAAGLRYLDHWIGNMQEFYKKALLALIVLLFASALLAWFCVRQSHPTVSLLPQDRAALPWRIATTDDAGWGGSSVIRVQGSTERSLRMDFRTTDASAYPFVSAQLLFEDGMGRLADADLSRYGKVSFIARCSPANTLVFGLVTFDERLSKRGDLVTYPSPLTFFSCNEQGVPVTLDLRRMSIPAWWFYALKMDLAHQSYHLDRVARFVFGVSGQTPRNRDSRLEISQLTIHGRDHRYLVGLAIALLAGLSGYALWFFKAHSRALAINIESRLKKDRQTTAYRQLTLEPFKDREKAAILRFIADNYTDPDLRLEIVASGAGASRNKVNEVLRSELGMTFTTYLNRLRLTEAARLLNEQPEATIAEIAYSVGYANPSYFNKLFKEEYGCTPKVFRSLAPPHQAPSVQDPG